MLDRGKRSILGVDISVIDYEAAVARIIHAAKSKTALGVSALAVHGVMTGATDPVHRYRLNHLDIVTPDGQPVRWALRLLHGERLADRVYGPELTLRVCEAAAKHGLPIYLYGSRQTVLESFREGLKARFPGLVIAGYEPSKFRQITEAEVMEIDNRVRDSGARIVLVGLGCPRQEVFVFEHFKSIGLPLLAVGAAFDFHAGLLPQAPRWMQARGLEWLFRLIQEPRRLWRRYLLLNPYYSYLIALQFFGLRGRLMTEEHPPSHLERYG